VVAVTLTALLMQGMDSLPATGVEASVFLVVGALGGAHCLGMCGPLVSVYADRLRATNDAPDDSLTVGEVKQHALFNLGRAGGYAVVGVVLATLGALTVGAFDAVVAVGTGVRATTGVLVGAGIMATGASYLSGGSGVLRVPGPLGSVFGRVSRALTARVDRFVGDVRIVGLGVGHAFLPCPITYPAYLYAFATADPLRAGFLLALLGLGTIPTLFVYGTLLGSLSVRHRTSMHRVLGAAFLLLGYLPLAHGLMLVGIHLPHPMIPVYQPLG
jgi:sulfite exporter TauE/SafE